MGNLQKKRYTNLVLRGYLVLVCLTSFTVLWELLSARGVEADARLWGLSGQRLILAAAVSAVTIIAFGLLLFSWIRKSQFSTLQLSLVEKLNQPKIWMTAILLSVSGLLGGTYLILLTPEITEPFTHTIFTRLLPLFYGVTVLCAVTLAALPLLRFGPDLKALRPTSQTFYATTLILIVFLLIWLFIGLTGLGVTATDAGAGWYYLASPITEVQVFLAWLVSVIYLYLARWGTGRPVWLKNLGRFRWLHLDLVLSIAIWLAAFLIWNAIPLKANWFAAPPQEPNWAFYPNSDAALYDLTGQSLLTGEGYKTHNSPAAIRPLYAFFLALLHTVEGYDYEPVIWLQVAVLALLPVLLYWITRKLHSRSAALIASVLLIFREANAISLGDSITSSHAKLLMSDLPTTLGVMIFILLFIHWLQNPGARLVTALVAGGIAGAFMLIRPEFGILLPFTGIAALFEWIRQPKIWLKGMVLIAVGVILALTPWIWRNYQATGIIYLDSPHYRADLFAKRYQVYDDNDESQPTSTPTPSESGTGILPDQALPAQAVTPTPNPLDLQAGETHEQFAGRLGDDVQAFIQDNISVVLGFITNHFLNSEVQTVLYLPGTFRLADSTVAFLGHRDFSQFVETCCSAENYIRRLPFWFKWDGNLPRQSIIPLLMNLSLISLGLVSAWKQQRFIGLVPLAASLGHYAINALVRNSGGRYILPLDWVGLFYFAVGLSQITLYVIGQFRGKKQPVEVLSERPTPVEWNTVSIWEMKILVTAVLIFLFSCVLPWSENLVPQRYPETDRLTRLEALLSSDQLDLTSAQLDQLAAFTQDPFTVTLGRALYPRFHQAGDGESGGTQPWFAPVPFSRMSFYMVGPTNQGVRLAKDESPAEFPNGSDVLVIGCPGIRYTEALLIVRYSKTDTPAEILIREPFPDQLTCPLLLP